MSDGIRYMSESSWERRPRRRHAKRRKSWDAGDAPIRIRIGNRGARNYFTEIEAISGQDGTAFQRMVHGQTRANPRDPILM